MKLLYYLMVILLCEASPIVFASAMLSVDTDGDGIEDDLDPLPNDGNSSEDWDGDGIRDAIDLDDDNDQVIDNLDEDPFNQDHFILTYTLEQEYNDEREFATFFEKAASGSLQDKLDVDWFRVPISVEDEISVLFKVSDGDLMYWSVDWYDPDMEIMSGRILESSFEYQFPAFKSGDYFVRVQRNAFYDGRSYEIVMQPDLYKTNSEICDGIDFNEDGVLDQDVCGALDSDGDGISNSDDAFPTNAIVRGNQFLQTTSTSANITRLHVLNTSEREQSFRALMFDGNGNRVGGTPLIDGPVPPMGRVVLTSEDIEDLFDTEPWRGPAMLQVRGQSTFDVMSKLISPSGLISNTNCVREDRVLNIEGFDSNNMSYVRFINTRGTDTGEVVGTLYDFDGKVVGNPNTVLASNLAPYQQLWLNRNDLANKVGVEWNGEVMLEVNQINGLKLLNLNYITDEQTFFNFSCFEDSSSGRVYLQTTSTSQNISYTHILNTSDENQQFLGTLFRSDGFQLGEQDQPLRIEEVPPKGRLVISSEDIETAFRINPWTGPAMLEVKGTGTFELMTKLISPSGLVSNTNCVRQERVHNIGGFDQTDMTYVRFINVGDTPIRNIRGSLYDDDGNVVGTTNPILIAELPAKGHVWRDRNELSSTIGDTWNGTASLEIINADNNLRLLNLNFINSETFFNFSCYETGQ